MGDRNGPEHADVRAIQQEADKLSKQFRELDMKIQSINWTEDLI